MQLQTADGAKPIIGLKRNLTAREGWGILGLVTLATLFIAASWRKWPDPLIDFGRELYIPWRLANGAVLYRDVDDFYGPLSQYFNAALFKCFGAGMMVLVTANLLVFALILACIYILCRNAWGSVAAMVSAVIFISVFGFSQLVGFGNYNYATPYAHEVTHGLLICLLLTIVLVRWIELPTLARTFTAGVLFGLTAVLKPEIMLSAAMVTFVAAALQWWQRKTVRKTAVALWAGGALLPSVAFFFYFAMCIPLQEALRATARAWLNATTSTSFTGDPVQLSFLGFDQPWQHLATLTLATLQAVALIAAIAAASRFIGAMERPAARALCGGLLAIAVGCLACYGIVWFKVGQCLLGLMLIYLLFVAISFHRHVASGRPGQEKITRLLLAVLATAMMARMVLNGRIYQFGFYQAALAGLVVPAVMLSELSAHFGKSRAGRSVMVVSCLALLLPGVVQIVGRSQHMLQAKTLPIGEGADRFYAFPSELNTSGTIVSQISEVLSRFTPKQTLVVLPEGEMINYLTRMPSPVAPFFFYSAATHGGREEKIVTQLQATPPDNIVIVSRDLREYGVEQYGEKPGDGQLILQWVSSHYKVFGSIGGDPLDHRQSGGVVLKLKKSDGSSAN